MGLLKRGHHVIMACRSMDVAEKKRKELLAKPGVPRDAKVGIDSNSSGNDESRPDSALSSVTAVPLML